MHLQYIYHDGMVQVRQKDVLNSFDYAFIIWQSVCLRYILCIICFKLVLS